MTSHEPGPYLRQVPIILNSLTTSSLLVLSTRDFLLQPINQLDETQLKMKVEKMGNKGT